jgi:hypothetical protein
VSNKVPGQAEKWDDVIRQLTSVWTPESAARVLAAIAQLDLHGSSSEGDILVKVGEKFVPQPPNPEITFTLSPGPIGDTSTHNYPVLLDGSGDPTIVGMVGAWANDENGNLVPPEDGVYEAVFEIAGVQSVAGAIALETSINSGSSAYAISAVNPYIPAVPSGGTARPVTTSVWNYTDPPVVGPDRSLGGLRIKHLEAASDGADVTFFVRVRKISAVL